MIWPGVDVELMRAKHSRFASDEQAIWLKEGSMPTSMYVSFMVFCLSSKYRNKQDRSHAAKTFATVCAKVCTALNGLSLKHRRLGSDRAVRIVVSATGMMNASFFWDKGEYFDTRVRKTWKDDMKDETKPWISTRSGCDQVQFADLVCFCLDPQHGQGLRNELLDPTLLLLSQLAKVIDENVDSLQRSSNAVDDAKLGCKNVHKVAQNIRTIWAERVAQKIWKGEETGIYLTRPVLFFRIPFYFLRLYFYVFFDGLVLAK